MTEIEKIAENILTSKELSQEEIKQFLKQLELETDQMRDHNPELYVKLIHKTTEILKRINDATEKVLKRKNIS